jgi:hypothetical protein
MMKTPDIGSVIQVREDIPAWGGCLMIVNKVADWGVQAYMRIPGGRGVQTTFLRLRHDEYYYIGTAEVVEG